MSDLKTPVFDGSPVDFDAYQRDVQLWTLATPLRPDQRAPSLVLHLKGKARQISQNMLMEELNQDAGVEYFLEFLRINLRLSNMHYAFELFNKLTNLRRGGESTLSQRGERVTSVLDIDSYINEFYHLGTQLHQIGIVLPEAVTTLILINQANLNNRERNLVQTILLSQEAAALNFDRAANALKQILRQSESSESAMYADKSDSESICEEEIDYEEFGNDFEADFEVFFVKRAGKYFRRYPKRFRSHFAKYRSRPGYSYHDYGSSSSSGSRYPSWHESSKGTGKAGKFSSFSSNFPKGKGKKGHSKGKGKRYGKAYLAESNPSVLENPEFPTVEKLLPGHTSTESNYDFHDSDWWYPEYEYDNSYYCDNWGHELYSFEQSTPMFEKQTCSDECHSVGTDIDIMQVLLAQSVSATTAVIDTGCTKDICGSEFLDHYFAELASRNIKFKRKHKTGGLKFHFGNGESRISDYSVVIPLYFGDKTFSVTVHVFDGVRIPLLLSLDTLGLLGIEIHCENRTISSSKCGVKNLHVTRIGRKNLLLPLFSPSSNLSIPGTSSLELEEEVFSVLENSDVPKSKRKRLRKALLDPKNMKKVHIAMGHCSAQKLLLYVDSIGGHDSAFRKLINSVIENCEVCQKFKSVSVRPNSGGWTAQNPNDVVFSDLSEFVFLTQKYLAMTLIDCHSRFLYGEIIDGKSASTTSSVFINYAMLTGSYPKTFLSDNGTEFVNNVWSSLADRYGFSHLTSPIYRPQYNGVVERKNSTIKSYLAKVSEDFRAIGIETVKTVFSETVRIINTLPDATGYTPFYKMFLRHPVSSLPISFDDASPAQAPIDLPESIREREIIRDVVRKAVFGNDCELKLYNALHQRIKRNEGPFFVGEKVYKYLPNKHGLAKWVGPYHIVGILGTSTYWISRQGKGEKVNGRELTRKFGDSETGPEFHDIDENSDRPDLHILGEFLKHNTNRSATQNPDPDVEWLICDKCGIQVHQSCVDDHRRYFCTEHAATVFFAEPYLVFQTKQVFADLPAAKSMAPISPREMEFYKSEIDWAKRSEVNSWLVNDAVQTFSGPLPEDSNLISTRWVASWKLNPNGTIIKPKFRLVLRGFQDADLSKLRTDSPTIHYISLKLTLQHAANQKWDIFSIDLTTAFLQGIPYSDPSRKVFCKIPGEIRDVFGIQEEYWILKKSVYGLKDGPRMFYLRICESLKGYGFVQLSTDKCAFVFSENGTRTGIVCTHVDDLMFCGTPAFCNKFIDLLSRDYTFGKLEKNQFQYCGIQIVKMDDTIELSQCAYANSIPELVPSLHYADHSDLLCKKDADNVVSVLGQLGWLSIRTRVDLSYIPIAKTANLTYSHLLEVNRVVKRAHEFCELSLRLVRHADNLKWLVYSDASLANNEDLTSQAGYLVFMTSPDTSVTSTSHCSLLDWSSKRIRRVTRSTIASECLALTDAVDHAIYVNALWSNLTGMNNIPIHAYTDNKSLVESLFSDKQVLTEKRLLIDIAALRESVTNGVIGNVSHVVTKEMLADSLTKSMSNTARQPLLDVLQTNKLSQH